jgi:hypothetical protein
MKRTIFSAVAFLVLCLAPTHAVERPFLLWTRAEAAAIRKAVETEPWARTAYERLCAANDIGQPVRNLFRYVVMGDAKAGEAEKAVLLGFIGAPVNGREWSDDYLVALRYDALHDSLTESERQRIEETFRVHVKFQIENGARNRARWNWLPNMQWPRAMGMHLMAVALADTNLVEAVAASPGGWRYYFDDYLSDGQFYNEEFGKMYSMIGEMFLWCRGCERLGLDRLGYGYTGKSGATMRRYIRSLQAAAYPRVGLGGDRPCYPRVTMGDAKGGSCQNTIVPGAPENARAEPVFWRGSNMNGRDFRDQIVAKMMEPLWYELAHGNWPEDGWDYFLAACRGTSDEQYLPSLLWGCPPIVPDRAKAPPAPSGVYPERGFAILRADESPAYWESAAPAIAMQFAQPYAHGVPDAFAILGFFAFNRPICMNRQVSPGYAGTDPGWSNSARSHSTVIVDGREPSRRADFTTRHRFASEVKFTAVRSGGVFGDVEQTRALALTREYVLDVFALESPRPRAYHWLLHTLGHPCPDNPSEWVPSTLLTGALYDLRDVRSFLAGERPWAVTAVQPPSSRLRGATEPGDPRLVAQEVGLRVRMLGAPDTVAHYGLGPMRPGEMYRLNDGADIPGEPTLVAYRQTAATAFVALHEPFDRMPRVRAFRRIARTTDAVLVAVEGEDGINDRIALRWGPDAGQPTTLSDLRDSITFTGFAWIRIAADAVRVHGDVAQCRLAVGGKPAFVLNGEPRPSSGADGLLVYPADAKVEIPFGDATRPTAVSLPAALSLRWRPDSLAVPLSGQRACRATLRNLSPVSFGGAIQVAQPKCASVEPAAVPIGTLAPGAATTLVFQVTATASNEPATGRIELALQPGSPFSLQPSELTVSCGVVVEHREDWPRRFVKRVIGPRYTADYEYHSSVAPCRMLDADGMRRDGEYPTLWRAATNAAGRVSWNRQPLGGYVAFNPGGARDARGQPFLAEMGQHPHGFTSPLVYHFREDWILVRQRQGSAEESVSFECGPWTDSRRRPASETAIGPDGKPVEKPQDDSPIQALVQADGDSATLLCLYPPGARWSNGRVAQPGNLAMAFTWCRTDEVDALLASWRSFSAPDVKPRQQGEVRE